MVALSLPCVIPSVFVLILSRGDILSLHELILLSLRDLQEVSLISLCRNLLVLLKD
jgi:hypothetical protein